MSTVCLPRRRPLCQEQTVDVSTRLDTLFVRRHLPHRWSLVSDWDLAGPTMTLSTLRNFLEQ